MTTGSAPDRATESATSRGTMAEPDAAPKQLQAARVSALLVSALVLGSLTKMWLDVKRETASRRAAARARYGW